MWEKDKTELEGAISGCRWCGDPGDGRELRSNAGARRRVGLGAICPKAREAPGCRSFMEKWWEVTTQRPGFLFSPFSPAAF